MLFNVAMTVNELHGSSVHLSGNFQVPLQGRMVTLNAVRVEIHGECVVLDFDTGF